MGLSNCGFFLLRLHSLHLKIETKSTKLFPVTVKGYKFVVSSYVANWVS